jgi:hypothetical protein
MILCFRSSWPLPGPSSPTTGPPGVVKPDRVEQLGRRDHAHGCQCAAIPPRADGYNASTPAPSTKSDEVVALARGWTRRTGLAACPVVLRSSWRLRRRLKSASDLRCETVVRQNPLSERKFLSLYAGQTHSPVGANSSSPPRRCRRSQLSQFRVGRSRVPRASRYRHIHVRKKLSRPK